MLIAALRRAPALFIALLASAAAADTPPSPAGQRLGTDVVPLSESVRLVADARKPDYTGSVRIDLEVRRPAAAFALHAEEMDLRRLALSGPGGAVDVSHRAGDRGRLEIVAAAPLSPGRCVLEIDFANEFDTHATGLYKMTAAGEDYLFAQLEADDARQAFPCWDEPSFKIPFQVTAVAARTFFADPKRTAPGMEKEMAKVTEAVKDCAALRSREGAAVATYLRR